MRSLITLLLALTSACAADDRRPGAPDDLGEQVTLCSIKRVDPIRDLWITECVDVSEACIYWIKDGDRNACLDIQTWDTECPCPGDGDDL